MSERNKKEVIKYFKESKIKCACGKVFTWGSTQEETEIEICSACHPFYTGEGKILDTAGRVERFKRLVSRAKSKKIAK